jgi:hypothetical protein
MKPPTRDRSQTHVRSGARRPAAGGNDRTCSQALSDTRTVPVGESIPVAIGCSEVASAIQTPQIQAPISIDQTASGIPALNSPGNIRAPMALDDVVHKGEAQRARSAGRVRGGAWRPRQSRARRSSPPSAGHNIRSAHLAGHRAIAPARPRRVCNIRRTKRRGVRNRRLPARGQAAGRQAPPTGRLSVPRRARCRRVDAASVLLRGAPQYRRGDRFSRQLRRHKTSNRASNISANTRPR